MYCVSLFILFSLLLLLSFFSRRRVISSCLVLRAMLFSKGCYYLDEWDAKTSILEVCPMYIMKWIEMNQLFNRKEFTGYSHNKS